MKKGLFTLLLALSASLSAYAGVFGGDNDNVTWDVRIGSNFNNLYARLNGGSRGRIGGFKAGLSASTNVRIFFNEVLALETGIGVQQKGSKDWTVEGSFSNTKYNSWYAEVPVSACARVMNRDYCDFFVDAGVYGSLGFAGKWSNLIADDPIFGKDGICKRGDFGIGVGISAALNDFIIVGARYQRSIIPIGSDSLTKDLGRIYNNGFSLRLGVIL